MRKTSRTSIIIIIFCLLSGITYAQSGKGTAVTGSQLDALTKAVISAHQQLKTLSASFTQEKSSALFSEKVVQKGKFNYQAPSKLRWEYTSPKTLTLLFDDRKVSVVTDKGVLNNPNKMLNELGAMIINTINGSNLCDNKKFDIKFFKNSQDGSYTAQLKPLDKKIQASYSDIQVILNGKSYLAEKVILNENNGDVTTITFSNMKINATLPEGIFNK